MNQLLEAALAYTSLGWQIFPLMPGQKIPFKGTHGVKDATTDEAQIRAWWEKWPNANMAVALGQASGVYVVDVDVTEAGDVNGYESLKEFPQLPSTIMQKTPRGGFHAFYRADDPPANRNAFRPGIEIRSNGYYVVLAPSIHPNGGIYVWCTGCAPWERQPAEFPDFMRPTTKVPWAAPAAARMPPTAPPGPADADVLKRASFYLAECEAAVQGSGGHDKLLWAAVAMVHGFLLSDSQALDLLTREYNPRCVPPWDLSLSKDSRDFQRKVSEARKLAPQKPAGWLLHDDAYASIDPAKIMSKEAVAKLIENSYVKQQVPASVPLLHDKELEYLSAPSGLLGEICRWINETAMCRQPFLTLACALTFLGVLFGRKIRDALETRTNLYCMGVADSSAGKDHPPTQIRKIAEVVGCIDLLGGTDTTGDSAIEARLEKSPATLFLWDEIGFLLSHIQSGQNQHQSRIVPYLMKLYSSAKSVFIGKEYANSDHQRTIIQPCCSIYGYSSPLRFTQGLSPEELQDGWLSRCLVFRIHSTPRKTRDKCDLPIPEGIIKQVSAWFHRRIREENDGHSLAAYATFKDSKATVAAPQQMIIPRTPEAEKIFVAFDDESIAFGKKNPLLACLWAKSEENARRVALILAASESFDEPVITAPLAEYATRLIRYLLLGFERDIVPEIVEGRTDALKQKLLKTIRKAGIKGCSKRDLTRGSQWTNAKERTTLLADLIEAEAIVSQLQGTKIYYWTVENFVALQQEKEV